MSRSSALLWSWWVRVTTGWWPDVPVCMRWRGWLYARGMREAGADFQVASDVRLVGLEHLTVGQHVYFAPGVVLLAACGIDIEDEVMLAFRAVVTDGNHTQHEGSYRFGPRDNRPVRIGRGSWVGAQATILPGTDIGAGVVVGANSVAGGTIADGLLVGGVPARPIATTQPAPEVAHAGREAE